MPITIHILKRSPKRPHAKLSFYVQAHNDRVEEEFTGRPAWRLDQGSYGVFQWLSSSRVVGSAPRAVKSE